MGFKRVKFPNGPTVQYSIITHLDLLSIPLLPVVVVLQVPSFMLFWLDWNGKSCEKNYFLVCQDSLT